jgi:uncharacterized membrane protein
MAPDSSFYVLLVGSALLAIGAIFLDSIPVLIASMIVAPLAYPILGMALGFVGRDWWLVLRSLSALMAAFAIAFLLAIFVTMTVGHTRIDNVFISFSPNWFLAAGIAAAAGCVAAYGNPNST